MKPDRTEGVYIISVAASLADMHPQTLRLYEKRGLLSPERKKNRRRYSQQDIERLKRIQELTQVEGLNLCGVRKVLDLEEEMDRLRDRIADMEQRFEEMQLSMLNEVREVKRKVALRTAPTTSLMIRGKKRR